MPEALTLPSYRRHHVTLLALCVAVQAIDATKRTRRPQSDQSDMRQLLDELIDTKGEMTMFIKHARLIVEGISPPE